jgi:hypothetical protein
MIKKIYKKRYSLIAKQANANRVYHQINSLKHDVQEPHTKQHTEYFWCRISEVAVTMIKHPGSNRRNTMKI